MSKKAKFIWLALLIYQCLSMPAFASNNMQMIAGYKVKAIEHALSGNPEVALDELTAAVDLASSEYGAHSSSVSALYYDMGTIALNASLFPKAQTYLQKAVNANPNSSVARVKLAELLNLMGQRDESKTELAKVLSKHANDSYARSILLHAYQEEGNAAQATKEAFVLANIISGKFKVPPKVTIVPSLPNKLPGKDASIQSPAKTDVNKENKEKARANEIKKQQELQAKQMKSAQIKKNQIARIKPVKIRAKREPKSVNKNRKNTSSDNDKENIVPDETENSIEAIEKTPKLQPMKAKAASIRSSEPHRSSKRGGLVPPPPPVVPVFPAMMPMPPVKTESPTKSIKKDKSEKKPETVKDDKPAHEEDPDFLLDWAETKKKK
jgi:hypothetical protein